MNHSATNNLRPAVGAQRRHSLPGLFLAPAAFLLACSASVEAGLIFTVEAAGVQQTSVIGAKTETFDALTSGYKSSYTSTVLGGQYTNFYVNTQNQYGGAGGTGNFVTPNGSSNLQFADGKTYFGLWWSAGDPLNTLQFFNSSNQLLGSYTMNDVIPLLSPAYRGNPNEPLGRNSGEYYAYLNFTTTGGDLISRVVLSGGNFESDNHSTYDVQIAPPGSHIPEPTTALFGIALCAVSGLRRRRS